MIDYAKLKEIFGTKLPEAHIFFATRAVRPIVPGYSALRRAFGLSIAHTNRKVWKKFEAEYAKQNGGGQVDPNAVTAVKLTGNGTNLNADITLVVKGEVVPSTAENLGIGWRTSNENVVVIPQNDTTVNVTYTGKGLNVGDKVQIIAQASGSPDPENPIEASYEVTITAAAVAVTGITLAPKTLEVKLGEKAALAATVAPSNATNAGVKWSSSASKVAVAEDTGRQTNIRGYSAGTSTITGTTSDGGKTDTATVKVVEDASISKAYLVTGSTGYKADLPHTKLATVFSDVVEVTEVSGDIINLKGLKEGASKTTITNQDGSLTNIIVIVQSPADYQGFNGVAQQLPDVKVGGTIDIKPSGVLTDTSKITLSDTSIATLSGTVVTGVKVGRVNVMISQDATSKDYDLYYINVVAAS